MSNYFLSFLFAIYSITAFSQEKKSIEAVRISSPPKIDGILGDAAWESILVATDFNLYQPGNEGEVPKEFETEVKIAYDNTAVYFAATMYDPNPDEILSQFSQRDEVFVQADIFYIALNTYNDGINETRFYIASARTIGDSKSSQNHEDFNYNVVYDCKISKNEKGWYAEFKIPYNALRFPEVAIQEWSFIDNKVGSNKLYNGLITGVEDIDSPTRLTFYPFAQGVYSTFDGNSETDIKAGLDLKYGLTDSFTLDLTLVPDFGQTAFDEVPIWGCRRYC